MPSMPPVHATSHTQIVRGAASHDAVMQHVVASTYKMRSGGCWSELSPRLFANRTNNKHERELRITTLLAKTSLTTLWRTVALEATNCLFPCASYSHFPWGHSRRTSDSSRSLPFSSPCWILVFRLLFSLPEVSWGLVYNVGNNWLYVGGGGPHEFVNDGRIW